MTKRRTTNRSEPRSKLHLIYVLLVLVIGLSLHSCADIPAGRELATKFGLDGVIKELGAAAGEIASTAKTASKAVTSPKTYTGDDSDSFSACRQFFANGKPPVVAPRPTNRDLCYDAFAILHSGESKTAVLVAEKLNRASIADADEKRTNKFSLMHVYVLTKRQPWQTTRAVVLIVVT